MKKVRALKDGFHGSRRKVGDVFKVPDDYKARWVEDVVKEAEAEVEVEAKPKRGSRKRGSRKQEPQTLADVTAESGNDLV